MTTGNLLAPEPDPAPPAASASAARPKLAAFHRDPPRPLSLRLDAEYHDLLDAYTRFYNQTLGAEVAPADVAAQIIGQWLDGDRAFRRWRGSAAAGERRG